jgi:hypothetical protein
LDQIELLERILQSFTNFCYVVGWTWREFLLDMFLREAMPSRIDGPMDSPEERISFLKGLYSEEELKGALMSWLQSKGDLFPQRESSLLEELVSLLLRESQRRKENSSLIGEGE